MTTLDSFRLFQDGIKKERTTTVSIPYFNRLINEVQLDWLRLKAPENDLEQKVIDELSILRVITDGTQVWKGNNLSLINPINVSSKEFLYPIGTNLINYPRYYRLQSVQFKMAYYNAVTGLYSDVSDWEYARILRSDKKAVMRRNYYRRAIKGRLYYEIAGNVIRAVSEENCVGKFMMLEYLRYPQKIWFDETRQIDHSTESTPIYTPGYGCIPCELGDIQTKEIVEMAVQTHLERTMDQRLPSFIQDQQMKK